MGCDLHRKLRREFFWAGVRVRAVPSLVLLGLPSWHAAGPLAAGPWAASPLSKALLPGIVAAAAVALIVVLLRKRARDGLVWGEWWLAREWFAAEAGGRPWRTAAAVAILAAATLGVGAAVRLGAPREVALVWGVVVLSTAWWGTRPSRNQLHRLAMAGDVAALEEAIGRPEAGIDARDRFGRTPLHYAAAFGQVDTARVLVARGAAVDAVARGSIRPVHLAAWHDRQHVLDFLLAEGASVNARTARGATPLHWAAEGGHIACVKCLLGAGADVEAVDHRGLTPERAAERKGHPAAAEAISDFTGKS